MRIEGGGVSRPPPKRHFYFSIRIFHFQSEVRFQDTLYFPVSPASIFQDGDVGDVKSLRERERDVCV